MSGLPTPADWITHREEIVRIYVEDGMQLKQVCDYMQAKRGFKAT